MNAEPRKLATVCMKCEKILSGGDWNNVSHGLCNVCYVIFTSEWFFSEERQKRMKEQGMIK